MHSQIDDISYGVSEDSAWPTAVFNLYQWLK